MQEQQDPTPDTADMKIESDPPRSNTTEQLKDVDNSLQENAKPSLDNASDKNVEDTKEVNGDQNEQNILTIRNQISLDALKDHMDETGEDVVHGDEDAVLY